MRQTVIALLTLLTVWSTGSAALAQDPKPEQKPNTPVAAEAEKPKSEVDKIVAEARNRGEIVIEACFDNCDGESLSTDGLERGRALHLPKPAYPAIARAARASGEVEVQVLIDVDGKVIAAAAISGHPLLLAASVQAARESLFSPTKLDQTPVKVVGVMRYNFSSQ